MKNHNYMKLMNTIDEFVKEYQNSAEFGEMIRGFNNGSEEGNIILRFEGDVGAKYRIVVPYLGKKYVVCWFQLCTDGSLYFGVRDKNSEPRASGTVKSVDGKITINMNSDELPPKLNGCETKDRFSFHGSGEIHDGQVGHTTYRKPIIQTTEQSELFWVCFREICFFEEIQQQRKDDISLNVYIPEKHMLVLHALIAPSDKVQLNGINNGKGNVFVVINFRGLVSVGDLSLQLVFASGANSEVPQRSIVVWPTTDIESVENEGRE